MTEAEAVSQEIARALGDLEEERATALVQEGLEEGVDARRLIDGVVAGLKTVGQRFETEEYFLLELMMAGDIGKKLMDTITPHLPEVETEKPGKVVIGSAKGDIHDIGKNIVITQLELAGFEVVDLGVDVPSMTFIDKAQETDADVIAMSAFLTTTMAYFREVINYLEDMGLRDQYRVIIGGGTTDATFAESIGADGTAPDAVGAARLCERMIAQKEV